ncbi:MAG: nucleotidyltransferase family protein [Candidatus Paceibacterota bacterium]
MKKIGFINSKNQDKLMAIFKEYGVIKAAVFGSYARGDERKKSDIDLLVKLEDGRTLMDLGGLSVDLKKLFGRRVDLVEYECIHPKLKKEILSEQVPIL